MWVLNGRVTAKGPQQRETIQPEGTGPLIGQDCVIFVHGFNKDGPEARDQGARLYERLRNLRHPALARTTFGVYLWPATSLGKHWWTSILYPRAVSRAEKAGRELGKYLRSQPWGRIVLVGHSMGARVALEAANRSARERVIHGLLLTGAAVRVHELEPGGLFEDPMADVEAALWCRSDQVLRTVFGPGQWLTFPFHPGGPAVGLTGDPKTHFTIRPETNVSDHRYWNRPETARTATEVLTGRAPGPSRRSPGSRPAPRRSAD